MKILKKFNPFYAVAVLLGSYLTYCVIKAVINLCLTGECVALLP